MKKIKYKISAIILLLFFITTQVNAQQPQYRYIQVEAAIDAVSNIYVFPIAASDQKHYDSLVNIKQINMLIGKNGNVISLINELSKEGWQLVTVTHVSKDQEDRPSHALLLYYFRKQFDK
jgi:hypothetical protein